MKDQKLKIKYLNSNKKLKKIKIKKKIKKKNLFKKNYFKDNFKDPANGILPIELLLMKEKEIDGIKHLKLKQLQAEQLEVQEMKLPVNTKKPQLQVDLIKEDGMIKRL